MQRVAIHITGIVQGVGFRPFVYTLAKRHQLAGWVLNHSGGVRIEVEGAKETVARFVSELRTSAPPLAVVEEILVTPCLPVGDPDFFIQASTPGQEQTTAWISPDVAACADCLKEMTDPQDRRYRYAFTNCTNCGPRYSIIKDIPYDRKATTMESFSMCAACQAEYDNPCDRRFHAQPNACPDCGPHLRLLNQEGGALPGDVLAETRRLIEAGHVVAIKGIGGYHLACDARQEAAVSKLRIRKNRKDKPFALMCRNMEMVKRICEVSEEEERLLTSSARPIVLLSRKNNDRLASGVAPGTGYLGVMLPYAPLHWLLLAKEDVWVMTSGNKSHEPIVYRDEEALTRLGGIADYFLMHNREIFQQSDDSLVRIVENKRQMLRRSRGYSPEPIRISQEISSILAVGGEAKNTFCLTRGSLVFMSAHMGDLENMEAYQAYLAAISHYKKVFAIEPAVVAYDFHPEYLSSKYALSLPVTQVGVQHHHAHIASVLAEHGIDETVLGVALDGTGYGTDGTLWGGEFLAAGRDSFTRLGHCKYLPLPGSAKAIKEPWRMAALMLYNLYGKEFAAFDMELSRSLPSGWELMVEAAAKGINTPLTSSAGRLFDIAAAILGICRTIQYEGQGAIELEWLAQKQEGQVLPYMITGENPYVLDVGPAFSAMTEAVLRKMPADFLAACFHETMADAVIAMVRRMRDDTGIGKVALSGGVWQNATILKKVIRILQQEGFGVYTNQLVPPNDGGLALGQAAVAGAYMKKR